MNGLGCCSIGKRMFRADGFGAHVVGAAVGRLHDSRASAGHDHVVVGALFLTCRRNQSGEAARQIVIATLCGEPFGTGQGAAAARIVGRFRPLGARAFFQHASGGGPVREFAYCRKTTIVERTPSRSKVSSGFCNSNSTRAARILGWERKSTSL